MNPANGPMIGNAQLAAWRQRGFNDALFRGVPSSAEKLAERAGRDALSIYRAGLRAGLREREKEQR